MADVSFPQVQLAQHQYPQADYSWLSNIPENFWKGQAVGRENTARAAVSEALKRGDMKGAIAALAAADPSRAITAGIANDRTADPFKLMQFGETQRHNQAMETKDSGNNRSYVTSVPDQYGVNQPAIYDRVTKQLTDTNGNPIQQGQRYRQFSESGVTKLTQEGQKYAALRDFTNTFKDSYGGANLGPIDYGNAEKTIGQLGIGTQNATDTAEWWQNYDRNKNVVRKDLFGTALTPTEQREFERADIRPGMDPAVIRHNLAIQKTIIERGMRKLSGAYKQSGYNPAVIDEAYGLDSSTLQDNPTPAPGDTSAAPPKNRVKGQTYDTPKGKMTWTGTGWVPAQ